jgi:ATP-binding cassette subfamily C protein
VGSTGAGKSTLADVILGLLEPDSGSVRIGGLPPLDAVDRWPGGLAYVPQQVNLVNGSVRDNVALGLPDDLIDDDRVWESLRRAHIADFLSGNREGLETLVGESGLRLSGGQRQRLGIARALYTRPSFLVLDEATSALDAATENAITETLRELEGEVTTVVIAHRLATIRHLEEGHVAGQGTFAELRALCPGFEAQVKLLGMHQM